MCVVGSGTRFLSGISVYTVRLANALAVRRPVSLLTMRQLLPTRLYPGRTRVGADLAAFAPAPGVRTFDGVDWFWVPSLFRALLFLGRRGPGVLVLQWWTGTVLHTYLVLALAARVMGARVVIEFHEVLDTGEARLAPARAYVGLLAPLLLGLADAFAVHSAFDRDLLGERYRLGTRPVVVLPHGPYDHYLEAAGDPSGESAGEGSGGADAAPGATPEPPIREAPEAACNFLFFGVIRPYKGLEDLVRAFDAIPDDEIDGYWLTVVGETWEGWTIPAELIERSRHRDRITFVNRYVHDRELDGYLRGADAVVLPYHRSSLSGPLHVAMAYGLPIVLSEVGGNVESAGGYEGLVLTPPADPEALRAALATAASLRGTRFAHPGSWDRTAEAYERLFDELSVARP